MTRPNLDNIHNKFIPPEVLSNNWQSEELTDLNEVIRSVMEPYSTEHEKQYIFRSDKLPVVLGKEENYMCMFSTLVSMIMDHPPVNSKLFLYVRCAEEKQDDDIIDLRINEAVVLYKIDIYCNITTDKNWELAYQHKMSECALEITKNKGSFSFAPISNTGCLFSVTLPEKFN